MWGIGILCMLFKLQSRIWEEILVIFIVIVLFQRVLILFKILYLERGNQGIGFMTLFGGIMNFKVRLVTL